MTITLALLLLAADAPNTHPWEEVNESDGVTVWNREVSGSSVREVKAQVLIEASPDRVWNVLGDVQHYVEFMPYIIETQVFEDTGKEHYEYQRIDPPIVDMRDYCVHVTLERDDAAQVYKRKWTEANDKGPPVRKDAVRVPINRGSWTLEPFGGGKTKLTYYLYTDPGGAIPAWMSNKANSSSIPDLMAAVRSRSLDAKWKRD